jgi:hypothetical protein
MSREQNKQTTSIRLSNTGTNILNVKFPPIVQSQTQQSTLSKQSNSSKQWKDLFADPLQKLEIIDNRTPKEKLYDELKDNCIIKIKMSQSEMKKRRFN